LVTAVATSDLDFLPYLNKVIKLPKLLRSNRRYLPELLLVLDRTDPLDALVLSKLRISAEKGRLVIQPRTEPKCKSHRK